MVPFDFTRLFTESDLAHIWRTAWRSIMGRRVRSANCSTAKALILQGFAGFQSISRIMVQVLCIYDKHMDANVYVGIETYGTTGLVNNPDAVETTAANGAAGTATWATKTPDEILKDVNDALSAGWAANEYDESAIPNHILLPYEQYLYIMTTKVTELATETIYDFLMKNNAATKAGGDLFIGATRWCKGAGTSGKDRMVVYNNDRRFVKMDELVPLNRIMSQPNVANVCYDTVYMANISEVQIFYPTSIRYVDGV